MVRMISSARMLDDVVEEEEGSEEARRQREHEQTLKRERMSSLVGSMRAEAEERAKFRQPIESEWIEDLQQYHARYTNEEVAEFENPINVGRSQVNIGKTREKTNGMIARLENILFPTDDRNWAIEPTPVPELNEKLAATSAKLDDAKIKLQSSAANGEQPMPPPEMAAWQQAIDAATAVMDEAKAKAKMMAAEIEDQLEECRYQAQCRDVLEDGCKVGTGLMLGPLAGEKPKYSWAKVRKQDETGAEIEVYDLQTSTDKRPAAWRLDYWACYPSTEARGCEDSEGFYIRHSFTAKQMRALAKVDGMDPDAIRFILDQKPTDQAPDYLTRLRNVGVTATSSGTGRFYTVWQYIGPLTSEHMMHLADAVDDADTAAEMRDADPLDEQQAIVWFCNDTLLKFAIYPLDSGRPLVHAWRFEKEEGSFWGYGLPRIMRGDQAALNGAWRLILDNAEISAGGMLVIDTTKVQALDGNNARLYGRKIWGPSPGKQMGDAREAFHFVDIPQRTDGLIQIIELARRQIDESTHQPTMGGDGEQTPTVTNTAQGTALWLQTFNVMLVRVIKNWDDDLSVPVISAFYDWNMQFSPKEEIKGDYCCKARGASVLLVREMQAQSILALTLAMVNDPVLGAWIAPKAGESVREIYRSHQLDPAGFVASDAEAQEELARRAEQAAAAQGGPTGPDPAIEQAKIDQKASEIEAKAAISSQDADTRLRIAELNYDAKMADVAAALNMSQDALEAKMAQHRETVQQKDRSIATEAALRASEKSPLNQTQVANE